MSENIKGNDWDDLDTIEPEGGLTEEDLSHDDFDIEEDPTDGASAVEPTTAPEEDTPESGSNVPTPTTESVKDTADQTLKFRAKIDHEEMDVSLNPSDLPSLFQKAQNHDRMQARHDRDSKRLSDLENVAKELGYESLDAMMENARSSNRNKLVKELVDGGTAREVAEYVVDQKLSAKQTDVKSVKSTEKAADAPATEENEFSAQVAELFHARPELRGVLKELPQEVTADVLAGKKTVLASYTAWERKQLKAENEKLKNERNLYAQQADAAAKAPVRGANVAGSAQQEKADPWLAGFDDVDY
jgi:hypothetical protein